MQIICKIRVGFKNSHISYGNHTWYTGVFEIISFSATIFITLASYLKNNTFPIIAIDVTSI